MLLASSRFILGSLHSSFTAAAELMSRTFAFRLSDSETDRKFCRELWPVPKASG